MSYTAPLTLSGPARVRFSCISLFAAWVYIAWPYLLVMAQSYSATHFNYHGFLILSLVVLLIRQQTSSTHRINISFSMLGLGLLSLTCLTWLTAKISNLDILAQVASLGMLVTIILTSYGSKTTTKLLLPLMSLFLLLPLGAELYNNSQFLFARILVKILTMLNFAVYWDQQSININGSEYTFQSLCAALHYATLYITFALFYATFVCKNFSRKILVVASSIGLPIILSILAFVGVIVLNNWYNLGAIPSTAITFTSWSAAGAGILLSLAIGMLQRNKKRIIIKNDGIDWHTSININSNLKIGRERLQTALAELITSTNHIWKR